MPFDARAIKLLEPGAHLTSTDHPGLRLEATATTRTWTYRYRNAIDGKLRQMKLGQWPKMSVHAAVVALESARAVRDAGRDPAREAKATRAKAVKVVTVRKEKIDMPISCRDVVDDYYRRYIRLNRAKKGADEVSRMFDTMLDPIANLAADQLTRSQAFDLIQIHIGAPVQAAKLRGELGAAWEFAIDSGRLPETTPNWWRRILKGKIRSKGKTISGKSIGTAKRVLNDRETGALIRWLENFPESTIEVLTLYLWTVCRGSEITAMEGVEIVEEQGGVLWWVIPKAKTKNARHDGATDLRVPLFGRARSIAERRKTEFGDGYLFPGRQGGHMIQKTVQEAVYFHQPYCAIRPERNRPRLPVTHWSPHDLRRTARTMLASIGCVEEIAEAIIGHMQEGVKGVYNLHRYDAERVVWLRRLDQHLESLVKS